MTKSRNSLIKGLHIVGACALMLAFTFIMTLTVKADADDTMAGAINYRFGTTQNGTIATNEDRDFYRFTLPSSGRITMRGTSYIDAVRLLIYDSNGRQVWSSHKYLNQTTKRHDLNDVFDFNAGTYYLCFEKSGRNTGAYNFNISFSSVGESFAEPQLGRNNSFNTANAISLNTAYKGQISYYGDDTDFYRFTLPSSGRITIRGTSYIEAVRLLIYDSNGRQVWSSYKYLNQTTKRHDFNDVFDFNAGTYYLCLEKSGRNTGAYNFNISFSSVGESFAEPQLGRDNSFNTANAISLGTAYKGQISYYGDDADFYRFTLPSAGRIAIRGTSHIEAVRLLIYDSNGGQIWSSYKYLNQTTKRHDLNEVFDFNAGTYYLCFEKSGRNTGAYNFNIARSVNVNFNANGGKKVNRKVIGSGSAIGALPKTTRKGHSFVGWYTAKKGGTKISAKTTVANNTTFHARWKKKNYTVKFNVNKGRRLSASNASKKVTYRTKYGKLPTPRRAGYKFAGWYTKKTGGSRITAKTTATMTRNVTVYARWRRR